MRHQEGMPIGSEAIEEDESGIDWAFEQDGLTELGRGSNDEGWGVDTPAELEDELGEHPAATIDDYDPDDSDSARAA